MKRHRTPQLFDVIDTDDNSLIGGPYSLDTAQRLANELNLHYGEHERFEVIVASKPNTLHHKLSTRIVDGTVYHEPMTLH